MRALLTRETSSAPATGAGLRLAFLRGPGLAEAELEFLAQSSRASCLLPAGPEACEQAPWPWLARLAGIRGGLVLARLNEGGRRLLEECDGAWLPDPWLALARDAAGQAARRGLPYALTVWENAAGHPSLRIGRLRRAAATVVRDARLVHCVSERAADYVLALDPDAGSRMIQVHPGVDLTSFTPAPGRRPADRHRFLFVGRLVPEKGVRELLSAFGRLRREGSTAELWLAGAGPLARDVEAAAEDITGLRYLGLVERRRLPDVLRACHTLVLPSRPRRARWMTIWEEQFGFVVAEAMACGLDVVASRCGSLPEVVGDAGELVPVEGLAEGLSRALRERAGSPEEWPRRSRAARARAARCFDARTNADLLLQAVEGALR
jgi:glycosyltransferase involved in cell wall biosynthesis